jgi:protein CpxP
MKKLMMICGLILGVVAFAQAQQPGGGRQGGGRMMNPEARVKQLDEKLKLSDEQKTKLTSLFTAQADAQKKMREEAQDGDREAMREKMQAFRADNEKKLNAILTADQQKAYKAFQEEQRAEMEKRMDSRPQRQN